MRLRFQTTPVDVLLVLLYVVFAFGVLMTLGTGSPIGLLLVIPAPGYLASAVLLPRDADGDWVLRLGLLIGLGLSLAAFVGVVLAYSPWGVTFGAILAGLFALSLFLGVLALLRRIRVPPEERLSGTLEWPGGRFRDYSPGEKALAGVMVLVLAVAGPLLATALAQPRPFEGFTELYLLGPSGNFTGYPSQLNVSESATIQVVITNHEGRAEGYVLRVDQVGVQLVYNASTKTTTAVELNRTTLQSFSPSLSDGAAWTQPFTFQIASSGTWQIQFILTMAGNPVNPYRDAYLLVRVV